MLKNDDIIKDSKETVHVDLQMEQVFIQLDGSIKYCPYIISPLRNYDINVNNNIHTFQQSTNAPKYEQLQQRAN